MVATLSVIVAEDISELHLAQNMAYSFYIKSTGFCWILIETEKPAAVLKSSTQFSNRFIMDNWLLSRLGWGIKLMLFIALGNAVKQAWEKASCLWWRRIISKWKRQPSFCVCVFLPDFDSFLFYALSILIILFSFAARLMCCFFKELVAFAHWIGIFIIHFKLITIL